MNELENVLTQYVRPALSVHGGDLEVLDYTDGVLRFRLLGSCAGCSAADLTTEHLINEELQKYLPGFRKAVLDTGVSEDLLAQARAILGRKKTD